MLRRSSSLLLGGSLRSFFPTASIVYRCKASAKKKVVTKYSSHPLSDRLVQRLTQPLRFRKDPILHPGTSEDVLLPILLQQNLIPDDKVKNLEYIVHDNIIHPQNHYSFLLPLVNNLFYRPSITLAGKGPTCIVITPSPELLTILYEDCVSLLPDRSDIEKIYMGKQKKVESNFETSVVAFMTPKHFELLQEDNPPLSDTRLFLLHHGDVLLENTSFVKTLDTLQSKFKENHSKLVYTQELSKPLLDYAKENMPKRWWINLKPSSNQIMPVQDIKYQSILVDEADRLLCITRLLNMFHKDKTIIYFNSVSLLEDTALFLHARDYGVEVYHSDLDIKDRRRRFGSFVNGYSDILLTTDLLLNENDIQGCSLSIQYRLPQRNLGKFLHRSWKLGSKREAKSHCQSFLLHFEEDEQGLTNLKEKYHVPIEAIPFPSEEKNKEALIRAAERKIIRVHPDIGKHFDAAAERLIKKVGEKETITRALFLLSKMDLPSQSDFTLLSKAAQARIAKKDKIMATEKRAVAKRKKGKKLLHMLPPDDFE